MYIKVGRLVSRNVVKKLLRAVPSEDLKGLKSICVRTVPHKATKKHNKRWGGIYGEHHESKVWIYLWSITYNTLKKCSYRHSNLYDYFIQNFAKTLYHEIGHHVHSKTEEYKAVDARLEKMRAKMRRMKLKTKPMALPNGDVLHVYTDEYLKIKEECDSLHNKLEHFADEYAKKALSKAREMNLLEAPHPTDIRFFKIIRDKCIDSWFKHYYKMKQKGKKQYIGWPKILGVFDHLRKCKLGNSVKYNLNELYEQVYGEYLTKDKNRRAFKKFVLKHVEPVWYVSKAGRRYPYFTEAQMDELKRHKLRFSQPLAASEARGCA